MQSHREERLARALRSSGTILDRESVERQIRTLESARADVWFPEDPDFPPSLAAIPDPPAVLFTRGDRRHLAAPCVAIVGTRAASGRGREIAFALAHDLAEQGIAIVSGLARGIDAAAHRGALDAGGSTIAVLGTGVERCFPPEEREVFERIVARGLVLSEFPPHSAALRFHFPRRNRIVSGLSRVVIIVEAGERSGALLTADWALAQGRDVMAVPGDILEPRSRGTNRLLKDGAHVLTASSDALDLLFGPDALMRRPGPVEGRRRLGEESTAGIEAASRRAEESSPQADRPDAPVDEPLPRRLARALTREARHAEEIAREVGASVAETRAALLRLEISGGAVREPGGGYRRPS